MAQTTTQKVPIFQAPSRALSVPTSGVEQLARAGQRIGQMGNEVRALDIQGGNTLARGVDTLGKGADAIGVDLQQHEAIADMNNLNTAHASTLLQLTQAQQKFFSDPANANNPQAVQQFQDQYVTPAADNLEDMAQTKAGRTHAADLSGNLQNHFALTSSTVSAANAALATKNSLQYVGQALTSATQINPGNIPAALSAYDTMMNGYASQHPGINIGKDDPARLIARRDIIASGLTTLINKSVKDTGQAPDLSGYFKSYGAELGGKEQQTLQTYADARVKAYTEQQKADDKTEKDMEVDASKQAATRLTTSLIQTDKDGNPTGNLVVPTGPDGFYSHLLKLGNMDGATEAQVKSAIELAHAIQKEPPGYQGAHDDATFNSFMQRAFAAPDKDPLTYADVNTARAEGKLTNQEYTQFNTAVRNNQAQTNGYDHALVSTALKTVTATLLPQGQEQNTSDTPGTGNARIQNFQTWFYPQLHALTTGEHAMSVADAVAKLVTPANIQLHGVGSAAPTTAAPAAPSANMEGDTANKLISVFKGLFGGSAPTVTPLPPKGQ